jgi:biotin operon repressor
MGVGDLVLACWNLYPTLGDNDCALEEEMRNPWKHVEPPAKTVYMNGNYWQQLMFPDDKKEDDICRRRHKGNQFSEAANPTTESKSRDRLRIVLYLRDNGGHTAEEVEAALGLGRSTVSARMSELKRDGMLVQTGRRPTSTGSTAGVYDLFNKQ